MRSSVVLRLTIVWAVAASLLVLIQATGQLLPGSLVAERIVPSATWGWAGLESLPQHLSRTAYFDHLAGAAEEWFRIEPDDPLSTARRLNELRQGCSVLLLAEHRPLTAEDRTWLVESCRSWAARCDGYLIALESGADVRVVRGQVGRLIEEIAMALRRRVKSETGRDDPASRPPAP